MSEEDRFWRGLRGARGRRRGGADGGLGLTVAVVTAIGLTFAWVTYFLERDTMPQQNESPALMIEVPDDSSKK